MKPEEPVTALEYTYNAKLLGAYDLQSNVRYDISIDCYSKMLSKLMNVYFFIVSVTNFA